MSDMNKNEVMAGNSNGYFLDRVSVGFETGAKDMIHELKEAQKKLEDDPSNPSVLARYQAKLQEYTLFRHAQTSTVKAYKDICAAIIQNFR